MSTSDQHAAATLASWADTPARTAITTFVNAVETEGGPHYLPPEQRIAVFDNDGTLWCEKPMPIQLDFTVRRFAELAEADPDLRTREPYRAAYEHDMAWLGASMVKHYHGDDGDLELLQQGVAEAFVDVTVEDYVTDVADFFAQADHPTLKRPYLEVAYQPMIELLRYLEQHGFATYIASGGDRDFMRVVASDLYAVPPERVVGSSMTLDYRQGDAGSHVLYKAGIEFFDDGPTKPVRIWSRIGRRPVLAFGNSNGDREMLRYAGTGEGPALRLLLLHDDGEREFAYTAGAEDALADAGALGWTVVSMKECWSAVFAVSG